MADCSRLQYFDSSNVLQVVGNERPLPVVQTESIDLSTEALNTVTYEHHEIHAGSHFYVCGFQVVSASASIDFTVQTPNTTKWAHMTFEVEGTTQTEFLVYEGVTASGGVSALPMNNDRNSSKTSDLILKVGETITVLGTLIFSQSKGFEGTAPARASSEGIVSREREIILKQNTKYLFRIRSLGAGNVISYCGEWYEHTNRSKYT
jgi:hypothetical protein